MEDTGANVQQPSVSLSLWERAGVRVRARSRARQWLRQPLADRCERSGLAIRQAGWAAGEGVEMMGQQIAERQ